MGVKEYSITDDSLEFGYKDAEDFDSERLMIICSLWTSYAMVYRHRWLLMRIGSIVRNIVAVR